MGPEQCSIMPEQVLHRRAHEALHRRLYKEAFETAQKPLRARVEPLLHPTTPLPIVVRLCVGVEQEAAWPRRPRFSTGSIAIDRAAHRGAAYIHIKRAGRDPRCALAPYEDSRVQRSASRSGGRRSLVVMVIAGRVRVGVEGLECGVAGSVWPSSSSRLHVKECV